MTVTPDSLLIYAPVPLYEADGGYWLEDQACNGLRLWAANFGKLITMHPVEKGRPPPSWIPLSSSGIDFERVEIVPLPSAYRPDRYWRHYRPVRRRIAELIDRAEYLSFSMGGLFGDWGGVACLEAAQKGRRFAVWTDRVESEVVRMHASNGPTLKGRIRAALMHRPMAWRERAIIRKATVGLFHGAETYAAYAPYARVAETVHDIHLKASDQIPAQALQDKQADVMAGPLRICYLGRADPMKGPDDWLQVLAGLQAAEVDFTATWLGDGERLGAMRDEVARMGLDARVKLPGFMRDRNAILHALRSSHVFLFCHKTPESPRNLIEALVSGAPIIGYDSLFPRDLIAAHGGGLLTPKHDVTALTAALVALNADRARLADLMARAAKDGSAFNDEAVFRHRSELIRKHLG